MTFEVMAVVLFSALLHAGWNALVRASDDKFLSTLHVVGGAGTLAALLLPALPLPALASWPWLLASALVHVLYFVLVARAYSGADLSFAYPLMRGTAPVLTAACAAALMGEMLAPGGWLGVALISTGVLALAWQAWRHSAAHQPAAVAAALVNAAVIALYTLVDGQGVRLSGHALAYTGWVFLLTALGLLAWGLLRRGRAVLRPTPGRWRAALLGGGGTLAAYSLTLWAMAQAPIALVAALRETSIVFGALLGWLFLKEHIARGRYLAIGLICAGAVGIRLG